MDDVFARLRLIRSPNIGPVSYRQLMIRFGSAQAALVALPDLATRGGGAFRAAPEAAIEREISEAKALRARHVFLDDVDYPALLAEIDNSPAVIMVMGDFALEAAK